MNSTTSASAVVRGALPVPMQHSDSDSRNGILASVALKATTSARGGEPQEIIETAMN